MNWAHAIFTKDHSAIIAELNDIDCLRIGIRSDKIFNGRNQNPSLDLTTLNAQIDLETNIVVVDGFYDNCRLSRSIDNDRRRPGFSLSDSFDFIILDDDKEIGDYGYLWGQEKYKNRLAMPSWNDILNGLKEFIIMKNT